MRETGICFLLKSQKAHFVCLHKGFLQIHYPINVSLWQWQNKQILKWALFLFSFRFAKHERIIWCSTEIYSSFIMKPFFLHEDDITGITWALVSGKSLVMAVNSYQVILGRFSLWCEARTLYNDQQNLPGVTDYGKGQNKVSDAKSQDLKCLGSVWWELKLARHLLSCSTNT